MADIIEFPGAGDEVILAQIGRDAEQQRAALDAVNRLSGGIIADTILAMAEGDLNTAWLILEAAGKALQARELTEKADRILGPRRGAPGAA